MWFPKRIPAYPRVSALKDVRGDIVGAKHYFFRWSMHLAYQTLVLLPGIHYYITRYALESNLRHFKRDFQPQCFMPKPPQTSTNHGAHLTRSPPPTEHALDTQSNHPACHCSSLILVLSSILLPSSRIAFVVFAGLPPRSPPLSLSCASCTLLGRTGAGHHQPPAATPGPVGWITGQHVANALIIGLAFSFFIFATFFFVFLPTSHDILRR